MLKEYNEKRDLEKSGEPKVKSKKKVNEKRKNQDKKNIFVVQKHNATRLHYDLRLQIKRVLKSWAVPKKPSDKEKRLAIQVEDHPLNYADFEGEIKEGYGKGKVEIWDKGKYENLKQESMEKCFKKGKIEIKLKGKQLKGDYALIQTKIGGKKNWLFFKMKK